MFFFLNSAALRQNSTNDFAGLVTPQSPRPLATTGSETTIQDARAIAVDETGSVLNLLLHFAYGMYVASCFSKRRRLGQGVDAAHTLP